MTQINVKEQGAMVRRKGNRLVITKEGQVLDSFPLEQVEQVVLFGNIQLTTQATATLLQQGVDVVFMSSFGSFRGRLEPDNSKHAQLRHQQLQFMSSETTTLPVARAIVDAKIHNQRVILLRQAKRLATDPAGARFWQQNQPLFEKALAGMSHMQQGAQQVDNVDSLRGYEGKAAVYYFEAVRTLLEPAWGFAKRAYYPPPDPFNALLSFAYGLLRKDVQAAVSLVGLDRYLGLFHEIHYGRPSLALDLMEEWRPLIADALCLELVNRGGLRPEEFVQTGQQERPIALGEASMERVLRAYGGRLDIKLHHPLAGGETTMLRAIELQVRRLARVVGGHDKSYEAMRAK